MQNKIVSSIVMLCVMIFGGVLVTAPVRGQVTVGNTTVFTLNTVGVANQGSLVVLGSSTLNIDALPQVFSAELRIGTLAQASSLQFTLPGAGPTASWTFDFVGGGYFARESELGSLVANVLGFDGSSLSARAIGPPGSFSMATVGSPSLVLGHAPIPEPSAFAAFAGLAGLAFVAMRRQRRS